MGDRLAGRVAFITGGARGQGRSHAVVLAGEGADIAFCDITSDIGAAPYPMARSEDAAETVRLVEAIGRRCVSIEADVRDTGQISAAVQTAIERLGHVDVLVANAGICSFGRFWEITDEAWDEMIAVDLTGAFKSMRAVVPHMISRNYGRIIATSSMAGRRGTRNLGAYVAAKFGVVGLVKTLALEVADKGITVNAVCPATVDTPMVHNPAFYGLFAPGVADPTRDQVEPSYRSLNPIPVPWMDPVEVSKAVAFLASDDARYVSGTTVDVNCGSTATMP